MSLQGGGTYRGRMSGVSHPPPPPLKLQLLPFQLISSTNKASELCSMCQTPLSLRYRMSPCYHIICQSCSERLSLGNSCSYCKGIILGFECLHPKDKVFACLYKGCCKSFLNEVSREYHMHAQHQLYNEEMDIPNVNETIAQEASAEDKSIQVTGIEGYTSELLTKDATISLPEPTNGKKDTTEDVHPSADLLESEDSDLDDLL